MQVDVITVGDALIDIYLSVSDADEHCHQSEQNNEICFSLGAKIPVDKCQFLLGGNACNTSVGFSRLGLKASIAAEIGDDEFSQKIINGLKKEMINLSLLKQTKNSEASFAIDLTFMKDRTIFSRHVKRDHEISFKDAADSSYIYLTSVGEEWVALYNNVFNYVVNDKKVKLAFNPGSKQLQMGVDRFKNILSISEILFINKEEAEDILYGSDSQISESLKKIDVLLRNIQKLGPKIVSITDGSKGSYLISQNGDIFSQSMIESPFLQKTGVGDAYASGLLAAIFYGENLQNAMKWGALNSSSVVGFIGAQTGLLTKDKILEKMRQLKKE